MDDKGWIKILNKVDSFGVNYNFQINTKDKFQTSLGALFTIFLYLVICILFIQFGADVYKRTKPKVSLNTDIGEYKEIQLSNKNFTYAYRIEDQNGLQMIDDSKFHQRVIYHHFKIINGSWKNIFDKYLPRKKCSEISNYKEKEEYFNISLESWNCIDFDNITLGGNWDGNFNYGLEVNTRQCQNGTSVICSPQEEINKLFSPEDQGNRIFYSELSMEVYPSMDDYNAPLKTHLVNNYELLNIGLNKRNVKTYKTTQIINDVGWFFPEYLNQDLIISTDTSMNDFTFKNPEKSSQLYDQFIYLGRKLDTYNRSYYKIQEAVAAVGGFSRIIYIVLNFMFYYAAQTYRYLFLLSNLFYESEETKKCNTNFRSVSNNLNNSHLFNNSDMNNLNLFKNEFNKEKFLINPNNIQTKNKLVINNEVEVKADYSNLVNIKSENKNDIVNNKKVLTNLQLNSAKKPIKIFYKDYFKYKYCCIKNKNQVVNNHLRMIKDYQAYFSRCLDILTYLNTLNEFKNLKQMLLDDHHRDMIETKKHKIKEKFSSSLNESKLRNLV
jgi:hypothetical protein